MGNVRGRGSKRPEWDREVEFLTEMSRRMGGWGGIGGIGIENTASQRLVEYSERRSHSE